MAKKAKSAPANFDASSYISTNVFSGKRLIQGPAAASARQRAIAARDRARKKLLASA